MSNRKHNLKEAAGYTGEAVNVTLNELQMAPSCSTELLIGVEEPQSCTKSHTTAGLVLLRNGTLLSSACILSNSTPLGSIPELQKCFP